MEELIKRNWFSIMAIIVMGIYFFIQIPSLSDKDRFELLLKCEKIGREKFGEDQTNEWFVARYEFGYSSKLKKCIAHLHYYDMKENTEFQSIIDSHTEEVLFNTYIGCDPELPSVIKDEKNRCLSLDEFNDKKDNLFK